jgi:AAA domain (dynein-related subfamily)
MKISVSDIPSVIRTLFHAKRVGYFRGRPGIAKSAMVDEAAALISREVGAPVRVEVLHLASMSEVDIRGYLILDGDRSRFSKPAFWGAVEASPYGIVFIDELPQASAEAQKAVAMFVLTRRLGDYVLPDGWAICAAGNRASDNAGAGSVLAHLINRMVVMDVDAPEVDRWVGWAAKSGLVPELIAFAKLRPNLVFETEVPADEDTPFCTPRSLHALSDVATHYPGGIGGMCNSKVGQAVMAGAIGKGAAAELAALVQVAHNLPTYEEIVAAPDTATVPSEPDQAYAAVMLAAVRCRPEDIEPVMQYLVRFQSNFVLVGLIAAASRNDKVIGTKAVTKWVTSNRPLLAKLGGYISFA